MTLLNNIKTMKLYWIYEQRFIVDWEFTENTSLNWYYDLSFFLDYPSYQLPTLTVTDWILTNTDKRIFIAEYDENVISKEIVDYYMANIPSEFNIEILTSPIEWIRENTSYEEVENWKFKLTDEIDMLWQVVPPTYLIIE